MSLAPLLDAAPAIPVHAFAAMAAFVLGVVQLTAPKGTLPHRTIVEWTGADAESECQIPNSTRCLYLLVVLRF